MADLMVHEPLSLEELHAETGMMLPERDLMQQTAILVAGQAQGNLQFSGDAVVTGVVVTIVPPP
jgi:hypothetical protein